MKRTTTVSVCCAGILLAAGMSHAQTRWGLLDVEGEVRVPGDSEPVIGTGTVFPPPTSPSTIPDWGLGNGAGQFKSFLITEVDSNNGVYMYARVQYELASSFNGKGVDSFHVDRTLEVGVVAWENGMPTGTIPTIPFLQMYLPTTPINEFAKASFNFEAQTLCGVCTKNILDCDIFEIDTGNGFEPLCGIFTGACIARWLAGDDEVSISFIWDPTGDGGAGSLTVEDGNGNPVTAPIVNSASGTIIPAPSSALLAVLGFGIAARRRR